MRTANLGSVSYTPGQPPADPQELGRYLMTELRAVSVAIQLLAAGHIDTTYAAPAKARDGDLRLADGTSWNPGSGAGVYAYYASAWHKLG